MSIILKVSDISKQYRLGLVGTGTMKHDLNRWWARIRGKEDPYANVGATNDRSVKASSDYVWALKDISFEVNTGEVLGIIGKNGAGKSTLLKILSKVTSPSTGVIKSRGKIASLLEVGTGFHPELTGRENIFLNGAILGMTKGEIASKIEEIISFSGCEMYVDTPVKRYSSGMRVRLAFAVAAHLEPDILVIDEVLAVGDAEFQAKAIGKMQDISKKDGRTVLFVSHNMAAVKNLCTRAIVLENGTMAFEGNTDEAIKFYLRSSRSADGVSLLHRTDRQGNGKMLVKDVQLFNSEVEPIAELISGNELLIRVSVKKVAPINYDKLTFAFNFRDHYEKNVLSFVTDEMGVKFKDLEQQDHFFLKIPKLYLRGDLYYLRVVIFEGSPSGENLIDRLENAVKVTVLPGDIWNTGVVNRGGSSAVIPAECFFNEA